MREKYIKLVMLIILCITLASCTKSVDNLNKDIHFNVESDSNNINQSPLINSSNEFGLKLFKEELNNNNKNIIISPISVFTAFNIISNGAVDKTKEEIKSALNISYYSDEETNNDMNKFINYLNNSERYENTGYIRIYNSLWIDDSFDVKKDFINTSKKYYNSDSYKLNLHSKDTVNEMNKWISDKTNGLIDKPINKIDESTLMTLFNVLHFKGKWTNTFNKDNTKPDKFYISKDEEVNVDMMNEERFIQYYEDKEVKSSTFNYYNGRMIIIVPKEDINEYASKLDINKIKKYTTNTVYTRAKVKIPVFNVEYKNDIISSLKNLGMKTPFNTKNADFSNISNEKNPLYLGEVLHNCVVSVDEEGTEAAALTSVALTGSGMPPEEIVEFYVDKPFMFIIEDYKSGVILFIGKVENPK